ncbi:type II toxin-antitoxin system RelE/ParE family toxin, partial [Pararhodospirillum oryzae]|uniref:type II toxin-antitoxin system RelE/ParE family toxin n=1 Tax=Pararhodospirillum oryzae TaxID=478448 RepID=UPI001478C48F
GVRKVRVPLEGRGKSGGARVVYFYRNGTMPLFLLSVFAKNEKDNLTQAERNSLAALVRVLVQGYGERS